MEFDPELYDNCNYDTLLPAKKLIEIISDFKFENNEISTILDIGCGSGNITKLISENIDSAAVIGCDIDEKMIDFAKNFNNSSDIQYILQDISINWKLFDKKLRELQGKVSVITSNFALTWVKDITTAANNISNLLSDNGIVVINIVYDGDIYNKLSIDERINAEKHIKYPNEHEFIGKWMTALKNSGLSQLDIKYYEPKSIFPENIYINEYLNIPINWYKSYSTLKNCDFQETENLIRRLLIEDRCKRLDMMTIDGQHLIEVTNYVWQICAQKL